jgi:hypothetical protein
MNYFMLAPLAKPQDRYLGFYVEDDSPIYNVEWFSGMRHDLGTNTLIKAFVEEDSDEWSSKDWTSVLDYFNLPFPYVSQRLHDVLNIAGVSNIDYYPVTVEDEDGQIVHRCFAFNLIGCVSCADMSKSDFSSIDGINMIAVDFESLVIDEGKTLGALMFRLAESVNGIVIHESVKNAIEAAGIDTLTFIPPEEWVG